MNLHVDTLLTRGFTVSQVLTLSSPFELQILPLERSVWVLL